MLQEDAERAEKEADEGDSDPDGSPKSSSSSRSSKSSFGVADQDSDEEAAKKPKRRSVGSAKAKPVPKGRSQPTKKGQKEKQELAENLDVAEKYLASLQEGQVTETRGAVAEKVLLVPCDVRLGYSIYI